MFEVMWHAQENNTGQRQKSRKEQPYKGVLLWLADTHSGFQGSETQPCVASVFFYSPFPLGTSEHPFPPHTIKH